MTFFFKDSPHYPREFFISQDSFERYYTKKLYEKYILKGCNVTLNELQSLFLMLVSSLLMFNEIYFWRVKVKRCLLIW